MGIVGGNWPAAALIAACTSCAAESTVRLRLNCNVTCAYSVALLDVICVRPGIWPNCRSSGVVTVPATVCASAPGNCAVTRTVGVSIFGKAATGNSS